MTPLFFVIVSLAAFRITHFLTSDTILDPLRDRLIERWRAQDGEFWIEGLTCFWCLGSIVSFSLVASLAAIRPLPLPALWALAVASVVGIVGEFVEGLRRWNG